MHEHLIVDSRFEKCSASERNAAEDIITKFCLSSVKSAMFVMDRGYPSAHFIKTIADAGHKFIIRCSSEFVKAMMDLPEPDNVFEYTFRIGRITMKVRVLKAKLDDESDRE